MKKIIAGAVAIILIIAVVLTNTSLGAQLFGLLSPGTDEPVDTSPPASSQPSAEATEPPEEEPPPPYDNSDPTMQTAVGEYRMTSLLQPEYAPETDAEKLPYFVEEVYWHNMLIRYEMDHEGGWFQLKDHKGTADVFTDDEVIPVEKLAAPESPEAFTAVHRVQMSEQWRYQKGLNWVNTYAVQLAEESVGLQHTNTGLEVGIYMWLIERTEADGTVYYKLLKEVCGNLISPVVVFHTPQTVTPPKPPTPPPSTPPDTPTPPKGNDYDPPDGGGKPDNPGNPPQTVQDPPQSTPIVPDIPPGAPNNPGNGEGTATIPGGGTGEPHQPEKTPEAQPQNPSDGDPAGDSSNPEVGDAGDKNDI